METTITTTNSTSKALAAGADDHDSEDVVIYESRTRERRKENEVGKRRKEIRCLRAEIHGRHASVPSKFVRRAAAAAAAALIPGIPRKPRVVSDIESYGVEESEGDVDDQVLQYVLRLRGVESFQCLEEIDWVSDFERERGWKYVDDEDVDVTERCMPDPRITRICTCWCCRCGIS